jgi:SIR2-like domain
VAYIERFPPPLLDDVLAGRSLPIIGAGFSQNAVLPTGAAMPLWQPLGAALGEQVTDFPHDDAGPIEATSAYEHEFGRVRLVEELRRLLHHGVALPGKAHREFCRLPFDIVCTTNIDCLLERGYDAVSKDHHVIVEEEQLSIRPNRGTVTLLKLHGDLIHPQRMVITEEDYDRFIQANPLMVTYLSNLLITRTPLFIGYSLDDSDFRQILAVIKDRLGRLRRQAYVLTFGAGQQMQKRYERRGVRCLDLG